MVSPQPHEACAEHKLSETKESEARVKRVQRAQWLRAAILGANDGLLSTTSLMLGVGAADESQRSMVLSGLAGAVAGALSMAVGEFVSVSTQRDIQRSNGGSSGRERASLEEIPGGSLDVKIDTGVDTPKKTPSRILDSPVVTILSPARTPTMRIMASDQTRENTVQNIEEDIYMKDSELLLLPNPHKAAAASALAFLCGSSFPLAAAFFVVETNRRLAVIVAVASLALALFGGIGAHLGGAPVRASAARVLLGGWISMGITYGLLKPLDRDDKGS